VLNCRQLIWMQLHVCDDDIDRGGSGPCEASSARRILSCQESCERPQLVVGDARHSSSIGELVEFVDGKEAATKKHIDLGARST
jgi:hypothetical protein